MPWIVLPWILFLLGLSPLGLLTPGRGDLNPWELLAALIFAGTGSLYAKVPSWPSRRAWVLGLSFLSASAALRASGSLVPMAWIHLAASLSELFAGAALLVGLILGLRDEGHKELAVLAKMGLAAALPLLERLAQRRPIVFLLIQAEPIAPDLLRSIFRKSDLVFELSSERYLVVLLKTRPEALPTIFRRLQQRLNPKGYASLRCYRMPILEALERLEAELEHITLSRTEL
jgi:hypothetical protein